MQGITIRPWRITDRPRIARLIREHLEGIAGGTGDFVVDDHNVNAMTDLGLTWSEAGEPTFLATFHGHIVGLTLAGPIHSPLHQRVKILHHLITHIVKRYQAKKIGLVLMNKIIETAEKAGYGCIDTIVFDDISLKCCRSVGFEARGQLLRKPLLEQTSTRAA